MGNNSSTAYWCHTTNAPTKTLDTEKLSTPTKRDPLAATHVKPTGVEVVTAAHSEADDSSSEMDETEKQPAVGSSAIPEEGSHSPGSIASPRPAPDASASSAPPDTADPRAPGPEDDGATESNPPARSSGDNVSSTSYPTPSAGEPEPCLNSANEAAKEATAHSVSQENDESTEARQREVAEAAEEQIDDPHAENGKLHAQPESVHEDTATTTPEAAMMERSQIDTGVEEPSTPKTEIAPEEAIARDHADATPSTVDIGTTDAGSPEDKAAATTEEPATELQEVPAAPSASEVHDSTAETEAAQDAGNGAQVATEADAAPQSTNDQVEDPADVEAPAAVPPVAEVIDHAPTPASLAAKSPVPMVALRATPSKASPRVVTNKAGTPRPDWMRSSKDVGSAFKRAMNETGKKTPNASHKANAPRVLPLPVLSWVSAVTGSHLPDYATKDEAGARDYLMNGVILCELANRLRPGSVGSIERNNFPFAKRQNVDNFIAAARSFGLKGNEIFRPEELMEGTDMARVFTCIAAVGRVSYDWPEFDGPKFSRVQQQAFQFAQS